jgi:hypothetical protein
MLKIGLGVRENPHADARFPPVDQVVREAGVFKEPRADADFHLLGTDTVEHLGAAILDRRIAQTLEGFCVLS